MSTYVLEESKYNNKNILVITLAVVYQFCINRYAETTTVIWSTSGDCRLFRVCFPKLKSGRGPLQGTMTCNENCRFLKNDLKLICIYAQFWQFSKADLM
jgi:hypothetical protein